MLEKQSSKPSQIKQSSLPENIPVTYLWFGKSVPEDYLISLADLDFPIVFLKNPKIDRNFSRQIMDVEKSDYYRLQHLYKYGGIYSDFDNIIDHPCLMKALQPYKNQDKVVFQSLQRHTRSKTKQMTNGMIYAPHPNIQVLKNMIDGVDETKRKIWQFAGTKYLGQFTEPIELNVTQCVIHTGDWSWFQASNQVLRKNTAPHERFANKLMKKNDFLFYQQELKTQLKQLKSDHQKLTSNMNEMLKQNKEVIEELNNFSGSLKLPSQDKALQNKQTTDVSEKKQSDHKKTNVSQQSFLEQIQSFSWARQKQTMQSYAVSLQGRNSNLKHQKDIVLSLIGGLSILLIIMLVFSYKIIKNQKNKKIDSVGMTEEIQSEAQNVKL